MTNGFTLPNGQYIPAFNANDLRFTPGQSYSYGDSNPQTSMTPGQWTLNNVGNYFPGWEYLNPNNWVFSSWNKDTGMDDPNLLNLMVKSGETEGTVIPFQRQGDQWVPNQQGMYTQQWDTNANNRWRNMTLGAIAAMWGGPQLMAGLQGAPAGGAEGLMGPPAELAGGGAGAAGGASAPSGLGSGMFGAGSSGAPLSQGLGTGFAGTGATTGTGIGALTGGGAGAAAGAGAGAGAGMSLGSIGSWLAGNSNWLMPLVGAVAGGAGSGSTTQTTEQRLPPWLESLSQGQAGLANNLLNMPYPGQEPFNADQNAAFGAVRNAANSPVSGQADSLASATLRGDYLNNNPYIDSMVNQTMNDLQGRFNTTALGSGSFGNANVTQQGMQGMADAANTLRFNNYNAERGRQMTTMGLLPTLDQSRYAGANNLLNIGNMQQQFGQQERYGPFNWYQNLLQASGIPITQYRGGTTTTTTPGNRASGALGGGLLGLQLAQLFGGGSPPPRYPGDLGIA